MGINISGIDSNLIYRDLYDKEFENIDSAKYMFDRPIKNDISAAYSLALLAQQNLSMNNTAGYNPDNMETHMSYIDGKDSGNIMFYQVKYILKSGRVVYRQYTLPVEAGRDQVKKIYDNKEYKRSHYPIFECRNEYIDRAEVYYADDSFNNIQEEKDVNINQSFSLKDKKLQKLLQLYKEELLNLTFDEVANTRPVIKLFFNYEYADINYYYVYPSFTKTIAYLKECGFNTDKKIETANITDISISSYNDESYSGNEKTSVQKPIEPVEVVYTKQQDIHQMLPYLLPLDIYQNNSAIINAANKLDVLIGYKDGAGNKISINYVFLKDKIPQRVIDDLKATVK